MKFAAEFVSSVTVAGEYPRWNRIETALAGRSNVGKSSLLNALTRSRKVARISKTPGRTRAVNFFAIGATMALVDLPGFGYAKMSKVDAAQIGHLMRDYLTARAQLAALILLIDARRGPEKEEIDLMALPQTRDAGPERPLAIIVVATKCDKLRPSQRREALARFSASGIEPLMCSAETGEGMEELRRRIAAHSASAAQVNGRPDQWS